MHTVTKGFKFAHRGHTVVEYRLGDQELPDEVARIAEREGWAKKKRGPKAKMSDAPMNKMNSPPVNKGA